MVDVFSMAGSTTNLERKVAELDEAMGKMAHEIIRQQVDISALKYAVEKLQQQPVSQWPDDGRTPKPTKWTRD